jgi:methionyl-tRNA synthetase
MTRDLDWGVPVPVEGAEGKVLYVWFDAPLGYITATQELFGADWEKWWKSEDTDIVHFIGKDNIVFHCIIFPSILMEHGGYQLPAEVPANEFLNLEGKKLSTSKNWAVWLHEYLEDFPGKQDELRYVLCATMPEAKDNDFTWADFQTRVNSELVAVLGNLVNRVVVLNHKYYNGVAPAIRTVLSEEDQAIMQAIGVQRAAVESSLESYRFRDALSEAMHLARLGNKYLADQEPWKLIKTDAERTETVLAVATQVVAALGSLMEPFLPSSAEKIRKMMGLEQANWSALDGGVLVSAGHPLGTPELLFDKVEEDAVERQRAKLAERAAPTASNEGANKGVVLDALKPEIQFDQFAGLDLRVARIVAAERVPKADKLLKLTVDAGIDVRTVLSGIAEHFQPEDVVGRDVLLLANLAPRMMRGIASEGMLLMAEDPATGRLDFVAPGAGMPVGSTVR